MNCNSACQWYQQTTRLGCELRASAAMMAPPAGPACFGARKEGPCPCNGIKRHGGLNTPEVSLHLPMNVLCSCFIDLAIQSGDSFQVFKRDFTTYLKKIPKLLAAPQNTRSFDDLIGKKWSLLHVSCICIYNIHTHTHLQLC